MTTQRPNVIMIMTDQQRYDALGCAGNPVIRTPHLDGLAGEGIRFERSYAASPVCMPSRGSIFTGRYARNHGSWNVGVNLPESEVGMSHAFRRAGYRTAAIGKLHLTNMHHLHRPGTKAPVESMHRNKGYDPEEVDRFWRNFQGDYYGFEVFRSVLQHGHRTVGGGHYDLWLRDCHPDALELLEPDHALEPLTGAPQSWKAALPPELHASNWIADETIRYLENHRKTQGDRPFFLSVGFTDPHHPLCPPRPYCDMYDPAAVPLSIPNRGELDRMPPHHQMNYNGVKVNNYSDQLFQSLGFSGNIAGLAGTVACDVPFRDMPESHMREMVAHYYGLITLMDDAVGRILDGIDQMKLGDNTIILFTSDHGDLMGDHGLAFKGPFHYESIIRIPTLWRWPEKISPGRKTDAIMSHVDILPTFMDACGLEMPPGVQGVSQLPVLAGERESCRTWALAEHRESVGGLQTKTLVTSRYKITYYPEQPYGELFDLQEDPKEYENLWDEPGAKELKDRMMRKLIDALCVTEDPLPERTAFG